MKPWAPNVMSSAVPDTVSVTMNYGPCVEFIPGGVALVHMGPDVITDDDGCDVIVPNASNTPDGWLPSGT
jgi:hypothetical protein